jgi:hypothetical protein
MPLEQKNAPNCVLADGSLCVTILLGFIWPMGKKKRGGHCSRNISNEKEQVRILLEQPQNTFLMKWKY